jgi:hypothetical protein
MKADWSRPPAVSEMASPARMSGSVAAATYRSR